MNRHVRVPIRVRRPTDGRYREVSRSERSVVDAEPDVVDRQPVSRGEPETASPKPAGAKSHAPESESASDPEQELRAWRDRALRLQAEMDNFRKRQKRLADERAEATRERLLRSFLTVSDDLERALHATQSEHAGLHEGVEMTYRSLKQLLKQEGVEEIEVKGRAFDPNRHEAIATVPHLEVGADENTVVEVSQRGYHLDGRLLRPARVVVAK
ncbi:MAG: nucleotide exchange factor GrpE [Anaerolineae bacterium]|jgi:molecular chaperone GrpE